MDRQYLFERNLLALSVSDPDLCERISSAETTRGRYRILDSRSGEAVPALADRAGTAHPLHSIIDPGREGKRLISTICGEGFIVFMGLGGGFHIQAAIENKSLSRILVIEFDIHGIAELMASREYIDIFNDKRVRLMVDPTEKEIESYILEEYKPVLSGGMRVIPLRPRVELDEAPFEMARAAVKKALDLISSDISVQAFFGLRWFSNIIGNLAITEKQKGIIAPTPNIAITAAGPSLDAAIGEIKKKRGEFFLLAVDTALPALLASGVKPDGVVTIDCQHISYYHFMAGLPPDIPLFLDLASPPLLASLAQRPFFFSGGHPLARYISRYWRAFPMLDTSGGNVTYTALSLAHALGCRKVTLYGADFSYPGGRTYAGETYVYPYFRIRENRLKPLEGLFSSFLYRNKTLTKQTIQSENDPYWYYETPTLSLYRARFEALAAMLPLEVRQARGFGVPVNLPHAAPAPQSLLQTFAAGPPSMSARDFLFRYRRQIAALPEITGEIPDYLNLLSIDEETILLTLLPAMASLKHRFSTLETAGLLDKLKSYSLRKIDGALEKT